MNRLTSWMGEHAAVIDNHANYIDRLAAYEDTGLEPQEVTAAKHALMGKTLAEIKEFEGIPLDRLRELAEAERDGRARVLPCKPGEYWRDQNGDRVRIETVSFIHSRGFACDLSAVTYSYEDEKEEFAVNWIYFRGHFTREEAENQEGGGDHEE